MGLLSLLQKLKRNDDETEARILVLGESICVFLFAKCAYEPDI